MDEEKNSDELNILPEVQFKEELPEVVIPSDGIEVITDDSLENYSEKEGDEEDTFELTFEETKKLLRMKMKKDGNNTPITEEMMVALTEKDLDELKELAKIRDRKALLRFVNHKTHVTDEEAEKLTKEEFLDLTNKALVMSKFLTYNSKNTFGKNYKKNRQRKNKMTKASRRANR